MKIASAELQMASSHASLQRHEVNESLRMWVGPQRPDFEGNGNARPAAEVVLSEAGLAAAAAETSDAAASELDTDPKTTLIRMMLEMLTGKRMRVFNQSDLKAENGAAAPAAAAAQAQQPAGYGIEYDYHESYTEAEYTSFSASGTVKTADGREIGFQLDLAMSRVYHEESSVSLRLGDAARKVDPLVLNFAGNAASLVDQRFAFDLDADGDDEQIARLASGSAYLVFDRNGDGRINDGRELFGPNSGDGFQELAALDDDGNGWIDEADAAYARLALWSGDSYRPLAAAGVGALYTLTVDAPFALKTADNELLGQIRSAGVYLMESGQAGLLQQVDLAVSGRPAGQQEPGEGQGLRT